MQRIDLAPDLLNRLRWQARRRGLSMSQALAIYLAEGLAAARLLDSGSVEAAGGGRVDTLTDALNGRR